MNESQTVYIYQEFDLITARRAVRRWASEKGLDSKDQIGISLATWSLARELQLGEVHRGEIRVDWQQRGANSGLRVVCLSYNPLPQDLAPRAVASVRWMVDWVTVDRLPEGGVQVTLFKRVPAAENATASPAP